MPDVVPAEGAEHWFYDGRDRSARWLIGQLWRCSDNMPWPLCEELRMDRGSTYAAAVQALSRRLATS